MRRKKSRILRPLIILTSPLWVLVYLLCVVLWLWLELATEIAEDLVETWK